MSGDEHDEKLPGFFEALVQTVIEYRDKIETVPYSPPVSYNLLSVIEYRNKIETVPYSPPVSYKQCCSPLTRRDH